jgi:hypothetical protein
METNTATTEYEAPRIEDHGDLTELTAAGNVGIHSDGEYTIHPGESLLGKLQSGP